MKTAFLPLACALMCAAPVFAAPADIVPRGHIAYDLLGSFAASGRLPGYTLADFLRGDRLFTRLEIARFITQLTPTADQSTVDVRRFAAMERVLRAEFSPELERLEQRTYLNSAVPASNPGYTLQGKVRLLTGPAAGTGTFRASATYPIGRDGFAAISATNYRDEWYNTRRLGARQGGYPTIETAYARLNGRVLDVSVGRMPLRFGPGYDGGLLLSDESRTIPQIRVEKTFRLPGLLRRAGQFQFTQVYGQFFEDDTAQADPEARGTRRHLAVRRLETASSGRFNVSLSEAYKSTRLPDPIWSQVLPFYQYQNDWTKESKHRTLDFLVTDAIQSTRWLNYLADANITYRLDGRGTTFFADLMLDDVKAPRGIGQNTVTPRKLGQQFGVHAPNFAGTGRLDAHFEVSSIDPLTYTNVSTPIDWANDGFPLGHPAGPNTFSIFGRVDARVSPRLRLSVEGISRRRRTSDPAAPQSPTGQRLGLVGVYDLAPNVFAGARLEHQRTDILGSNKRNSTRFELNIGAGL